MGFLPLKTMFFYLSKILFFLTTPIVWIFGLFLWGMLTKKPLRKKRLLWASLICFYFFSNAFITDEFVRAYEERNTPFTEITEKFDVAIVLGGFSNYDADLDMVQFHSASDRLTEGIRFYKSGKAKKIMIVSGSGQIMRPDEKEALYIKEFLLNIGIPENDLIIESESKNTHENAVFAKEILDKQYENGSYVLITSAFHMPRAKRCFDKVGIKATPYSVDQQAGPRKYLLDHLFIPDVDSLRRWQMLIKEWVGFITYWVMGYI